MADHDRRRARQGGRARRFDALVLADTHQITLAAAGRLGDRWPRGRPIALVGAKAGDGLDGVVRASGLLFRVVSVPLQLADVPIGTLYLATDLDQRYAEELATLADARTAIVSDGLLVASTLPSAAAREFEAAPESRLPVGNVTLDGQSYAFRRLVQVGSTSFYALGSIDESSRGGHADGDSRPGRAIAAGAACARARRELLARAHAHRAGRPAVRVARARPEPHDVRVRLPLTGSSRELDALDRDVQRADGVGGDGRGADAGGVYGRDSRAGDGARRARSLHGGPFRARQRAVGGHRPRAAACRPRRSKSSAWARCCTTSARSACPTTCCSSPAR